MQHVDFAAHLMSGSIVFIWIGVRDSDTKGFKRANPLRHIEQSSISGLRNVVSLAHTYTIAGTRMHGIH
jgi:hypothetical protein